MIEHHRAHALLIVLRIAAAEDHHAQFAVVAQHRQRHRANLANLFGLRQQQQQFGAVQAAEVVLFAAQPLNAERLERRTRQRGG